MMTATIAAARIARLVTVATTMIVTLLLLLSRTGSLEENASILNKRKKERKKVHVEDKLPSLCSLILFNFDRSVTNRKKIIIPNNRRRPFSYYTKMADFEYFRVALRPR